MQIFLLHFFDATFFQSTRLITIDFPALTFFFFLILIQIINLFIVKCLFIRSGELCLETIAFASSACNQNTWAVSSSALKQCD